MQPPRAIEKVAEVRTIMLITAGDAPNAFAMKTKAQPLSEEEIAKRREEYEDQKESSSVVGFKMKDGEEGEEFDEEKAVDVNIIGINFAMLDMLGMDMHMAAALIGHELGHIVLDHGEDSKRNVLQPVPAFRQLRPRNSVERMNVKPITLVLSGWWKPALIRRGLFAYRNNYTRDPNFRRGGSFVGTHPSSTERIARLKSLARRLSTR